MDTLGYFEIQQVFHLGQMVVLKYVIIINGDQFVIPHGVHLMLKLLVVSWVFLLMVCFLIKTFHQVIIYIVGTSYCCARFGPGYGPVWMSNLACTGSTNSLFSCSQDGLGSNSCPHTKDASAGCRGDFIINFHIHWQIFHCSWDCH